MKKIDLDQYRLEVSNTAKTAIPDRTAGKAYSAPRQKYPFLKGPIPRWWLERAATLPGKAFTIGVVLWYRMGITKKNKVRPSWKLWAKFSIGRHAAYRGLKQLESAELICVERCIGKNPVVTVITEPAPEWGIQPIEQAKRSKYDNNRNN